MRANWHTSSLADVAADDPEGPSIEEVGIPLDLADSSTLSLSLIDLCRDEADLRQAGVSCALRDRPDTTCSACPVRHHDPLDSLTQLCTVGCEQERVATTLAVVRGGET